MSKLKIVGAVVLLLFLTVGIGVGVYFGVNRNQDIRSKAAGCTGLWPADPNDACAKAVQVPAQNAPDVSLTPDFHWVYEGCAAPSGCTSYSASVFLVEGSSYVSNKPFARADVPANVAPNWGNSSVPVYDAKFSDFKMCDYGVVWPNDPDTCHTDRQPQLTTLKPGTTYWWRVTPYFEGTVHAEQTWNYTFSTKAAPSPLAACQKVTASKDLDKIKIGDTVTFTGYGTITNPAAGDSIDKVEFTILKDGTQVLKQTVDTIKNVTGDWEGSLGYNVTLSGSYSVKIRVHRQSTDTWLE